MHRPGGGREAVCDNERGLKRERVLGGGWTQQRRAPSLFSSATVAPIRRTSEDGSSQSSSRRCRRRGAIPERTRHSGQSRSLKGVGFYANLRCEAWWDQRLRFERRYCVPSHTTRRSDPPCAHAAQATSGISHPVRFRTQFAKAPNRRLCYLLGRSGIPSHRDRQSSVRHSHAGPLLNGRAFFTKAITLITGTTRPTTGRVDDAMAGRFLSNVRWPAYP